MKDVGLMEEIRHHNLILDFIVRRAYGKRFNIHGCEILFLIILMMVVPVIWIIMSAFQGQITNTKIHRELITLGMQPLLNNWPIPSAILLNGGDPPHLLDYTLGYIKGKFCIRSSVLSQPDMIHRYHDPSCSDNLKNVTIFGNRAKLIMAYRKNGQEFFHTFSDELTNSKADIMKFRPPFKLVIMLGAICIHSPKSSFAWGLQYPGESELGFIRPGECLKYGTVVANFSSSNYLASSRKELIDASTTLSLMESTFIRSASLMPYFLGLSMFLSVRVILLERVHKYQTLLNS